ncbi:MAG: hypothetical protein JXJ19_03570 [Elusimicrobia bacterium]|nr:hypothetical protein [Elusimicrobiota bacterium]
MQPATKNPSKSLFLPAIFLLLAGSVLLLHRLGWHTLSDNCSPLSCIPGKLPGGGRLVLVAGMNDPGKFFSAFLRTGAGSALAETDTVKNIHKILPGISEAADTDACTGMLGSFAAAALYVFEEEKPLWLAVTVPDDIPKMERILAERYPAQEDIVTVSGNVDIYGSSGMYYAVTRGNFLISNSAALLKNAAVTSENGKGSFHDKIQHLEDIKNPSCDLFTYIYSRELADLLKVIYKDTNLFFLAPSVSATVYQEYFFGSGIKIITYMWPGKREYSLNRESVLVNALPERPILAGAVTGMLRKKDILNNKNSRILNYLAGKGIKIKEWMPDYIGDEAGYSILGPSPATINTALPGMIFYIEIESREKAEQIYSEMENMIGMNMNEKTRSGKKFKDIEIPVIFGQKIQLCVFPVRIRKREFLCIVTSEDIVDEVADMTGGRRRVLRESPYWARVSGNMPGKYSSFSYADINALSATVGLFIADIGVPGLKGFLATSPFSWMGPAVSATVESPGHSAVHTYIPIRDLDREQWDDIFLSFGKLSGKSR